MSCPSNIVVLVFFFFNDTATTEIYTLSLHDALPISGESRTRIRGRPEGPGQAGRRFGREAFGACCGDRAGILRGMESSGHHRLPDAEVPARRGMLPRGLT